MSGYRAGEGINTKGYVQGEKSGEWAKFRSGTRSAHLDRLGLSKRGLCVLAVVSVFYVAQLPWKLTLSSLLSFLFSHSLHFVFYLCKCFSLHVCVFECRREGTDNRGVRAPLASLP